MLAEKWELKEESLRSGQLPAQRRHPGSGECKRTPGRVKEINLGVQREHSRNTEQEKQQKNTSYRENSEIHRGSLFQY